MASQSPDKEDTNAAADPYLESWSAMTHLVMEEGASWSGREKNCVFLNLTDGRFSNISAASHADYADDARAVALIDWDHDGALDLVLKNRSAPRLRMLRNQAATDSHWIQFKLRGTGSSNRDAIGSRVRVIRGEESPRVRSLRAGDGYLSQSTRFMHFGLGDSDEVCVVEVVWPDGQVERYEGLAVDRIWRLVQGAGHAVEVKRERAVSIAGAPTSAIGMSESEARRIVLIDRLPMSAFPLPSYDRPERSVADFEGGPMLINLWGLSCANCFKELAEFRDASGQLQAAGLRVVPLSTDPVEQQDRAREVIGNLGHGVLAGPTNPKQFAW
ncbi:MAG: ASPIC/UnbV domain-containing protein [Planctomycetes bacterium]|nr:ASPIC/UnbV domain-containing protein [Planctomycetota bacterium]